MTFNPITHIRYFIYLLQLENYNLSRFLRASISAVFHTPQTFRLGITWTPKLCVVTTGAGIFMVAGMLLAFFLPPLALPWRGFLVVLTFFVLSFGFFIPISLVVLLLLPLDVIVKRSIVRKARNKIQSLKGDVTVVGITGSYGKTTMKEMVAGGLSGKLSVLKTEENKNTPLGISRQILNDLSSDIDVYVVEMGAYERGDIKELVELVLPSVVILTGINEAHLERQGSIENTIKTKFEIVKHAPQGTHVILNRDDSRVYQNAQKFLRTDQTISWYSAGEHDDATIVARDIQFSTQGETQFHLVEEGNDLGKFSTHFLPSYIAGNVAAAILVGRHLGVSLVSVKAGVLQVQPVPHRLQPSLTDDNVLFIDDAYNGNPDGVQEALKVLARFDDRRKVYLTPGLVEMGKKSKDVHLQIGRDLADVADLVLLIENQATTYIYQGLQKEEFNMDNVRMFETTDAAHAALRDILKPHDVILFQNDIAENYM